MDQLHLLVMQKQGFEPHCLSSTSQSTDLDSLNNNDFSCTVNVGVITVKLQLKIWCKPGKSRCAKQVQELAACLGIPSVRAAI